MKKLVKYTVYFEYEDKYWDTADDDLGSGEDHLRYFIEEHNCHTNFLTYLIDIMEKQGDDICGAGTTKVISEKEVPDDIDPYRITEKY